MSLSVPYRCCPRVTEGDSAPCAPCVASAARGPRRANSRQQCSESGDGRKHSNERIDLRRRQSAFHRRGRFASNFLKSLHSGHPDALQCG
nr:MAG TPA: hypothetical protein [Inoviridae sp.]